MRNSNIIDAAHVVSVSFCELDTKNLKNRKAEECSREAEEAKAAQAAEKRRREAELKAAAEEAFFKGRETGAKETIAKLEPLMQALGEGRRQLDEARTAIIDEAERHAVDLAVQLAKTVMQTQVTFSTDVLHASMKEALARTAPDKTLRVFVNAEDLEAAAQMQADLDLEHVEILPDKKLGRGGCRFETELGNITSALEDRWQAAEELLRSACGEMATTL